MSVYYVYSLYVREYNREQKEWSEQCALYNPTVFTLITLRKAWNRAN